MHHYNVYRCWVLFADIENGNAPCRCCSPIDAIEGNGDIWACYKSERAWLIVNEAPDMSLPHPIELCDGDHCPFHRLQTPELASFTQAVTSGMSWGDLSYEDEQLALAAETPAQKAAREAKLRKAEYEAKLRLEAARMERETELVELRAKMGLKRGEAPRKASIPCKKLYSCVGDKSTGGAKPTTMHVSSECWAWEYTDPRDKKKKCPHKCPWIHPGEEGWHEEWMKNRTWKAPTGAAAVPTWRTAAPARAPAPVLADGWEMPKTGRRR